MQLSRMTKFLGSAGLALGLTLGMGTDVSADEVLQLDLNNYGALWRPTNGSDAFSADATGTIHIGGELLDNGILAGIDVGPDEDSLTSAPGFDSSLFEGLVGSIDLLNGNVVGGSIDVTARDNDTDLNIVTYSASLNNGSVSDQFLDTDFRYVIGGNTTGGFSDEQFAGVDVSPWTGNDRRGSFLQFQFNPQDYDQQLEGFRDSSTDMDLTVVVPTPAAALAGLPLLGVLGLGYAIRRRRMATA